MKKLVNPTAEAEIESAQLVRFVNALAEISIHPTLMLILASSVPNEPVKRTLREQCLSYLDQASRQKETYIGELEAGLPAQVSQQEFSQIVNETCMNTS